MPEYGLCWRPTEASVDPGWRPYFDRGHWIYTDNGWFWQSDYPWGDIVFHYGRWFRDVRFGWLWSPDYVWGPSWVCWRQADGYCGWAPLPPAARFQAGVGLVYNGRVGVGVELDFGLHAEQFVFVGYDHFWEHDYHRFLLPRERMGFVFRSSRIMSNYRFANNHFVVGGIGHERMAELTHRKVEIVVVPRSRVVERREARPEFRPAARPEMRPDARPESRSGAKPDVRPDAKGKPGDKGDDRSRKDR